MISMREDQQLTKFEQMVREKLSEIDTRLARLENRTAEDEFGTRQTEEAEPEWPLTTTRGRKSKLALDQLLERRRCLIEILDQFTPEIIGALQSAGGPNEAAEALENSVSAWGGPRPPMLLNTRTYAEQLWSFLKSDRFHGNLRNLANAMAGVPEMSWKRSFDLCVKNPPKPPIPVHPRAIRDFLNRNFPERLRELEAVKDTRAVRKILARSRSKDPDYLKLKTNPGWVLRWISDGITTNSEKHSSPSE
jgi:hypothetical protein